MFMKPQLTMTRSTKYGMKDQKKSDRATQFIGLGCKGSSTNRYRIDWKERANTGEYTSHDVIFVSVNGERSNGITLEAIEPYLELALKAYAQIITDKPVDRNRGYNTGERELANYLEKNGYTEIEEGLWDYVIE